MRRLVAAQRAQGDMEELQPESVALLEAEAGLSEARTGQAVEDSQAEFAAFTMA